MKKRFAVFALAAMMLTGCAAGEPTPDPLESTAPVVVPDPEPVYEEPAPAPAPPVTPSVSQPNCDAPISVGEPGWDLKSGFWDDAAGILFDGDGVECEK